MNNKTIFQSKIKEELFKFLQRNKRRRVLNFLNLHDIYQSNKEPIFEKAISGNENLNFIDGFAISAYLSIINLKRIPRIRGPTFTKDFLFDKKLSGDKKHFFIGLEKEGLKELQMVVPHIKKAASYNPPYVKKIRFSKEEIEKMSKLIKNFNPDYVWVGIGCPKQNILSKELFKKTRAQYFVNIGAALDFLLDRKKEAPLIVRELGIEWLYRLITDFKYSGKKVWRSLVGLKYLRRVELE